MSIYRVVAIPVRFDHIHPVIRNRFQEDVRLRLMSDKKMCYSEIQVQRIVSYCYGLFVSFGLCGLVSARIRLVESVGGA
jgi:hypothetical protein